MEDTSENRFGKKPSKHICIGLLAHVDAGKTTLAEGILYTTGTIRTLGRVDHRDAFLDTDALERSRGITIFSKQAQFELGEKSVMLLDTPGHVDFSAEMERTLQVLDYAVMVISGADGVQGYVQTLWKLLQIYKIPVFLFINKMDQEGAAAEHLLEELKQKLDDRCIDFGAEEGEELFQENLAMCQEELLEKYLERGRLASKEIAEGILKRQIFPCYFGSALKLQGIDALLEGIARYTVEKEYPTEFGARVFKITRDHQGNRLTHMKITGGSLKVKMPLSNKSGERDVEEFKLWEEKVDQIRSYFGAAFEGVQEAGAGTICAVTGLSRTCAGEGLGIEKNAKQPVLEPVLTYQIQLPQDCSVHEAFLKLRQLEEEDPALHFVWDEQTDELQGQVMGEVQLEVLKSIVEQRFGISMEFGARSIVYKETLEAPVIGVGHFEPLRHYAEVHLLMEPLETGSGLQFETVCGQDILDKNWQRLILSHLEEKPHRGVLTGGELTDVKITLVAGRGHQKHTEGGDFRQATYRAVRQGLKGGRSVLLEPMYEYRLEVPGENIGRAINDIQRMHGTFSTPEIEGELSVLKGTVPVVTMEGYGQEVTGYTGGRGRLFCSLKGYGPCHNAEEVIDQKGYDSEKDKENPTCSVFCAHGAGFLVPWNEVRNYMHVSSGLERGYQGDMVDAVVQKTPAVTEQISDGYSQEKELEEIFSRTYGRGKKESREKFRRKVVSIAPSVRKGYAGNIQKKEEYLLVDGYNIIFAWEDLKELAKINLESARSKLMDILTNYQGFKKNVLILVFDAYKVEGNRGEVQEYHNIHVVYTKEAETADQYIEKTVHKIGRKYNVVVATSDAMEQMIILGDGARRLSAGGLREEIESVNEIIKRDYLAGENNRGNSLLKNLPKNMAELLEEARLGTIALWEEDELRDEAEDLE